MAAPALSANKINGSDHDDASLKIIIVGGGIGGLTAAISLRRQGHEVDIYEQSQLANEVGAAIHVAPNANSSLERLGVRVEESGAIRLLQTRFLAASGGLLRTTDNTAMAHRWQSLWLLAHRAQLHTHLEKVATSSTGEGKPVRLYTSSKIVEVNPSDATIVLATGKELHGDLIIGADGVHSVCRKAITEEEIRPFKTDHSAFRFLVTREAVLADPETREIADRLGSMDMWYGADRKIVLYPCANNTLLNFVCIHPASLSDASGKGYNDAVSKKKLLDVYQDFDSRLLKIFQMADSSSLKLYPLFDMEPLPTFVRDRMVLVGDAAHPFTPHLAQGGAMAIEDGVSIGVMLSWGVSSREVPERVELYNEARYERGTLIQKYSRIVGGDGVKKEKEEAHNMKVFEYIDYGCSHDEHHSSVQILRKHLWDHTPKPHWRHPTVFGPMPEPRQDLFGRPRTLTARIKFRTSATLLRNMFPSKAYRFIKSDTVALASLSIQSMKNVDWLAGGGYEQMTFQIHNVLHTKPDRSSVQGSFCPVLFGNLTDHVLSCREKFRMPALHSDIDIRAQDNSYSVEVSWRGTTWASIWLRNLHDEPTSSSSAMIRRDGEGEGLLFHKSPTSTTLETQPTKPDPHHDVLLPGKPTWSVPNGHDPNSSINGQYPRSSMTNGHDPDLQTECRKLSSDAGFRITSPGPSALPTLHHIVSRLQEVQVFGVVDACLYEEHGLRDVLVYADLEDT